MITAGHHVAVPWGLDEIEVLVQEVYTSGNLERALVLDETDVCPSCGRGEPRTFVVPMTLVQLLPPKPVGLWYRNAKQAGY